MKRFLLSHLHLKIIALLISLAIWFFAALNRNYLLTRRLPIKFAGLPDTKIVSYQSSEFVELALEGKGKDFLFWPDSRLFYPVVVQNMKSGRQRVRFTPDDLKLGRELVVKGFRPDHLEFEIDDLAEKVVEVRVPLKEEVEKGFLLVRVAVVDTVRISGPKGELPFLTSLATESLSLKGLRDSKELELKIIPPDKRFFSVHPKKVRVAVAVEPEATKIIEEVLVTTDRRGVKITPRQAKVLVAGPASRLPGVSRESVRVFLALADSLPGVYNLPARISLPPGILFKRCEPEHFRVEIR